MSIEAVWPETPQDSEAETEYYATHTKAAVEGETVWIQRNFNSDRGQVLDLFADGRHQGYIEQDFDLGATPESSSCSVYIETHSDEGPELAIDRDLTLAEASRVLLEAVFPTESD